MTETASSTMRANRAHGPHFQSPDQRLWPALHVDWDAVHGRSLAPTLLVSASPLLCDDRVIRPRVILCPSRMSTDVHYVNMRRDYGSYYGGWL
jgi:hypothetical protein